MLIGKVAYGAGRIVHLIRMVNLSQGRVKGFARQETVVNSFNVKEQ